MGRWSALHAMSRGNSSSSLPHVTRRSLPNHSLQRSSAKHGLRSPGARFGRGSALSTTLPQIVPTKEPAPPKEIEVQDDGVGELCAICLEPLRKGGGFPYPCGHGHRLHSQCAIHFLACSLAMPLRDGTPGPLQVKSVAGMGVGFKAIRLIEGALKAATQPTLSHMPCPLCRGPWPPGDAVVEGLMAKLRESSVQGHSESALKMKHALSRVLDRLNHGEEAQRARMTKALISLDLNLHSASSFFAYHKGGNRSTELILSFLRYDHVSTLSEASLACARICLHGGKLRAPYIRVAKVRKVVHHVWAPDLLFMEVIASAGSPCTRSGTNTTSDAVAFAQWLCGSIRLKELTLHGMQWEKIDPGGLWLESCVANKSLRVLDLSHNILLDSSVTRLALALMQNPCALEALEVLILDLNAITEKGLLALLTLGRAARGIRTWGLRHNKLRDAGCRIIAEADPKAAAWDLRTNGISAAGCESLALALENMTVARLGCNALNDAGVEHLAQGLGNKLKVLDLRHGRFGDEGGRALGRLLVNATSLQELLLSGNEIGAEGARTLAEGWRWLRSLHHVDLSSNAIGSHGVELMSFQLPFWQQSPFRLSLVNIGCGTTGVMKLRSALETHCRQGWQWVIELQNNGIDSSSHVHDIRRLLEEAMSPDDNKGQDDP